MKVAVFGHYDSRGGTTAIRLPDEPTKLDVIRAMKRYDVDVFGIEEPGDQIETTAYGMEARECDKLVHDLMYPDETTPAEQDFLYIAELHGAGGGGTARCDLEEIGSVLISGADWSRRGGLVNEPLKAWYATEERDLDKRPPEFTIDELIEKTLVQPVQLEFVTARVNGEAMELPADHPLSVEAIRLGLWSKGFSCWRGDRTPEQEAAQTAINAEIDRREKAEEARVAATARIITDASYVRWDDDAYGFILMDE